MFNSGDVVVLAANTLCGAEPEGYVTTTTLYLDHDYVIDQVFWQYAAHFKGRLAASDILATNYAEPAQARPVRENRSPASL
ncbi:hypothetical protein [Arthrobacter sp. PAMC 25486]|uniref:hypothetical protein n=1 Tax=Arthrobacter sp. PAMC 25486 TaxID=1494608 RepID=UPI0012FF3B59|nr:hypothetical protein [Arthrobacter sp. PAMC 25486]